MTAIVALESDGRVIMGGDRAFSSDRMTDLMASPKVVRIGAILIGACGGMREGQELEWLPPPPKRKRNEDALRYLARTLSDPLRLAHKRIELAVSQGFCALVGYEGRAYALMSDGGLYRSKHGYNACGSGEGYALGSFASTEGRDPRERVMCALRAAARHSPYVAEPFDVLEM